MADHQIRHLPVVENDVVVGMLSERDLLPIADELSTHVGRHPGADVLKVRDAMTSQITTSHRTPLCPTSRETLIDHRSGAVPVVDDKRRPIDIVSYVDVLCAFAACPACRSHGVGLMATTAPKGPLLGEDAATGEARSRSGPTTQAPIEEVMRRRNESPRTGTHLVLL
jgi:CBS domain-containing protein